MLANIYKRKTSIEPKKSPQQVHACVLYEMEFCCKLLVSRAMHLCLRPGAVYLSYNQKLEQLRWNPFWLGLSIHSKTPGWLKCVSGLSHSLIAQNYSGCVNVAAFHVFLQSAPPPFVSPFFSTHKWSCPGQSSDRWILSCVPWSCQTNWIWLAVGHEWRRGY